MRKIHSIQLGLRRAVFIRKGGGFKLLVNIGALAAGKRAATARRAASALHPTHPRSALIKSWSHSKKAAEPETIKRGHMCDTPGRELCARRFLFTPQPHPL